MPRPLLILAIFAVMLVAAAHGGVIAEADGARDVRRANDSARFQAHGTGSIALNGSIVTFGLLPERAALVVTDRGGDGYVTLDGRRRLGPTAGARPRTVRMPRAQGRFYVSGSNITLTLRGANMTISAAGSGIVRLLGDGQFSLNEGPSTPWATVGGGVRRVPLGQ